jgi:hypothetical protein
MPLNLPSDLEARLRVAAEARGEEYNRYAVAVLADALARDTAATEAWNRARAEAQAILNGPFHPFDPAADRRRIKEKYGIEIEDLSHLSREELAAQADATLAALSPEVIAEAERQGLL